jgi:hypothetical protein
MSSDKRQGPNSGRIVAGFKVLGGIVAGLAALASIAAIIGFLFSAGILRPIGPSSPNSTPTLNPTPTLNTTPIVQNKPSCTLDNKLDPNTPWQSGGEPTTTSSCTDAGLVITQAPHASSLATVVLRIPQPGYQPDRDYSISLQVSHFASPQSCAGVLVRWSGIRAYGVELCQNGVWVIFKTFATTGTPEKLSGGNFTVTRSGSYQLNVEVSHDTLTGEVATSPLAQVPLDPTFQDLAIGLFVDGSDPNIPLFNPSTNPGASAAFSSFIFTPLP